MKKKKIVTLLISIMILFIGIINVYAEEINLADDMDTANVKEVSPEEYAERVKLFLEQAPSELKELYIEEPFMLGNELFDEEGNLRQVSDYRVKYVESRIHINSGNSNGTVATERELTAEEYRVWTPIQTRESCDEWGAIDCWETNAKKIIIMYYTQPNEMIAVLNNWKNLPRVRSYDTIGVVYNDFTMSKVAGRQWYNTSDNPDTNKYIDYFQDSSNVKISTAGQQGASISQNIVDNAYTRLQNDIYVYGKQGRYMQVAGSYQHSVNNISLATSQNFTFDAWGMGKVFNWNVSWNNWDNMQGVCFNWSPYLWTC